MASEPTLLTSFYLHPLFKDLIPLNVPILKSYSVGLPRIILG